MLSYATFGQLLRPQEAITLGDKFPAIFRGEFDTGVWDEHLAVSSMIELVVVSDFQTNGIGARASQRSPLLERS